MEETPRDDDFHTLRASIVQIQTTLNTVNKKIDVIMASLGVGGSEATTVVPLGVGGLTPSPSRGDSRGSNRSKKRSRSESSGDIISEATTQVLGSEVSKQASSQSKREPSPTLMGGSGVDFNAHAQPSESSGGSNTSWTRQLENYNYTITAAEEAQGKEEEDGEEGEDSEAPTQLYY